MAWRNSRLEGVNLTSYTGPPQYPRIRNMIRDMINASQYDYHESEAFLVKEVIMNGSLDHGAVKGIFINNSNQEPTDGIVYPLMPNITNIPLVGEHVVVTEYEGKHFYTSIINIKNSSNENAIIFDSPENTKFGKTFKRNTTIKRVDVCEGEIVFEGRFGNSIKLGCNHKNNSPNIKIRAGQRVDFEQVKGTVPEDINEDKSSIYLSTDESFSIKGGKFGDKRVSGNSIVMNSDKLFFNSRDGDVHLRASKDVIFESSKGSIVLNAKSGQTIKMGDPKAPMLPTINGQKLLEFQTSIMGVLTGIQSILVSVGSGLLPKVATDTKKLLDDIKIVEEGVTKQTFLNKQVLTADPNFKVPEIPKIPEIPDPKLTKLKLDQGVKLPKKPSIEDLTDKI
tara:strand:+ start:191 stop:1372 length:1182 start_codon:yes stop_codon:yes gene_type:complete